MLAANNVLGARMLGNYKNGIVEGGDGLKHVKSKTRRLKSQKLAKFQKLFKSKKSKKPSKIGN